jgi:hypothetical protein
MKNATPTFSRIPKSLVAALVLVLVRSVPAQTVTPRDPRSPNARFADGRGPTGPVTLKIVSPAPDEVIPVPEAPAGQPPAKGGSVTLKVELSNFELFEDAATKSGQRLEVLVDNIGAMFPWRDATRPYTFKSLPKGTHTVRIFPVRPWGEAIKDPSAFAIVTFHVGGGDGKNTVESRTPVLTVVAPRGKVNGDAGWVLLDVLVSGCPVAEQTVADSCRLRYKIDTHPEVTLTKVAPVWLDNLTPGRHDYVVGLTRGQNVVPGAFALYQGSFEVETSAAPQARPTLTPTATPSEVDAEKNDSNTGEATAYFAQKRDLYRRTGADLALQGGSSNEQRARVLMVELATMQMDDLERLCRYIEAKGKRPLPLTFFGDRLLPLIEKREGKMLQHGAYLEWTRAYLKEAQSLSDAIESEIHLLYSQHTQAR